MKIVGLPGRNKETDGWLNELLALLALGEYEVLRYRHWADGTEPNIAHEMEALRGRAPDLVVAKSMGTIVATTAYRSASFRPARAVLIGSPIGRSTPESQALYRALAEAIPTLFIQQTADFTGTFVELESIVQGSAHGQLAEVPGNDHAYSDTARLASIVASWVAASADAV
jgi:hypothetical protein